MSSAWLLPEHIADVLPAQARHIEELRRGLLDAARELRLRAGDPAAARAHRVAAVGHRPCARPADLQARRPAQRPHARPARRQHAAGRAHRRPPAQPQRRRPPVLLRPGAAHPGRRAPAPAASRCSSAPRSTATPASRPTSRSWTWRSSACGVVGLTGAVLDLADARIVRAVLAGVPVDAARLDAVHAALARQGCGRAARRSRRAFRAEARRGLRGAAVAVRRRRDARRRRAACCRRGRRSRAALDDLRQLAAHAARGPTRRRRSASTSPTRAATPTTAAPASRSTPRARATRSRAAAATTRSARSSAATGRRSASASTSRSWPSSCRRPRRRPAIRAPWRERRRAARRGARNCAAGGETVVCVLPGDRGDEARSSTATASWSPSTAAGSCAAL